MDKLTLKQFRVIGGQKSANDIGVIITGKAI
jgi:hypothetical protein